MDEKELSCLFDGNRQFVPRAVEDPWQALADAVVEQAAKDYRSALVGVGIGRMRGPKVKRECEGFFHSQWFTTLCNLDGNTIIRKLSAMKEVPYEEKQTDACGCA